MEDMFIYEGSRMTTCTYRENEDYSRDENLTISEQYFCRFHEYDLDNRRQKLDMKVLVGNPDSENNPFYIEVGVTSSFLVYDIRYMVDIENMLKKEALGDLVWSYLAAIVLKLTLWSNKFPPYFLRDFILEELKEMG